MHMHITKTGKSNVLRIIKGSNKSVTHTSDDGSNIGGLQKIKVEIFQLRHGNTPFFYEARTARERRARVCYVIILVIIANKPLLVKTDL